ncbi:MAG: tryptophan--tRNA ligase [Chloroflexi bacterium]|nr:tryptophan--tRNA ligase [Chloroflexota bacterium]
MAKQRILTGDRPTGRLHLGHYVGTLVNRVRLQDEYECFFIIADLHVLTTEYQNLRQVKENIVEMVLDYLSVGIDPQKSTIYLQSLVPQVTELFTLFSMLVTVPRLQRVPTLKQVIHDLDLPAPSLGLLAYPVLQAADILMVRANLVPVGQDQASHVEVAREIARRFNQMYSPVFPEPEALVGDVPILPGTDGTAKMSKSLDNAIFLSDAAEVVEVKVMSMYTDPTRIHVTDPGHVEGNPVFTYHDAFNGDRDEVAELKERYRTGQVGDVEVKRRLARALNRFLDPIRQRRTAFEGRRRWVEELVVESSKVARDEASQTLALARQAMGIDYFSEE